MSKIVTGTTTPRNIVNTFDFAGMLLGLPRLPGEQNDIYRRRLLDVYPHRAGASEPGLINGITRELGLEQFDALAVDYTGLASNSPRVIVRDVQVELYSNWRLDTDNTLDTTIDIYSRDSAAYFLSGLVTSINAVADWTVALGTGVDGHTASATLANQDTRNYQQNETVKPYKLNVLEHNRIVPGTVKFSRGGDDVFHNSVVAETLVLADGDYYIDHPEGRVVSWNIGSPNTFISYYYDDLPYTLTASPVILHEFSSDEFRSKIFEQILQPDGTYEDGLPKQTAIDHIAELLKVKGMLWGQ